MEDSTKLKIGGYVVQIIGPLGVLVFKYKEFLTVSTGLSMAAIIALIIVFVVMRKQLAKLDNFVPGGVGVLILFLIAIFCQTIGDQLLWLTAATLTSTGVSAPLHIISYAKKNEKRDQTLTELSELINKNK